MKYSICTISGREFDFSNPQPSMIDIEDIAHGLSKNCRFNGHITSFYSVAQHSVLVCHHLPIEIRLYGLLHDASEAYFSDIVRPAKNLLGANVKELENSVMTAVAKRFDLPPFFWEHPLVVEADNRMLITERNQFQPKSIGKPHWASLDAMYQPYDLPILALQPRGAFAIFMENFRLLTEARHVAA